MTMALIDYLLKKKLSVGVVSRGYHRQSQGVLEVDLSPKAALTFGDEPALIKNRYPDLPIFVGEKRFAAAQALLSSRKVDFILCDDAFQHRSLHRDLNVVLLDATEPTRNYRVLPVGLARESLQPALKRADFVVLTKTNLVDEGELKQLSDWLEARCNKPIITAEYHINGFRSVQNESRPALNEPVLLVSGIAKPKALIDTLGDRVKVAKHKSFPDHHRYKDIDVEIMLDEASQLQARWILTTAKDAMKLASFPRLRERLWIVELGIKFSSSVSELYEAIDRLARSES